MKHADIVKLLGKEPFDYQVAAIEFADAFHERWNLRACLYYKTGAGKSITSLAMLHTLGYRRDVLVIAPPATHSAWQAQAAALDMHIMCISHAKFRQKTYKVSRTTPIIADEFHMFGGHGGAGWVKFDRMARYLQAPVIMLSATPNYNDAERVYCIHHVLDPVTTKGGYLEFLYRHCVTEENHFSRIPNVTGFKSYSTATEYLIDLPGVFYVEDDVDYTIEDVLLESRPLPELDEIGLSPFGEMRICASKMEEKHIRNRANFLKLIAKNSLRPTVRTRIETLVNNALEHNQRNVMLFCASSKIAEVVANTVSHTWGIDQVALITGETKATEREQLLLEFKQLDRCILIGTAAIATGTDGLDKVCDTLIIVDDTEDDSLRRQVIGRIMPRGADTDASMKKVFRLKFIDHPVVT